MDDRWPSPTEIMASIRPFGTNRMFGKNNNNLVIKGGTRPPVRQEVVVEGKGKRVSTDRAVRGAKDPVKVNVNTGSYNTEASSSIGLVLKVKRFVRNLDENDGRNIASEIYALGSQEEIEGRNLAKNHELDAKHDNINDEGIHRNGMKEEFIKAWKKPQHIKILFNSDLAKMSDDGITVKLNAEWEVMNAQVLKYSLVIKVLGDKITFPMCSLELRRQWNKFGSFHMISLGINWILC
ncbi:uncharacterized protein LOC110093943 [Dendrobium catenatum]|uniref:uncharacterized protein LOC110093943 n=1 Tax=Dendrobium catenatum TaxID=906689 RepID=UPI0009F6AAC3|nr:uncharacterized protein LOC110093943 [Dendrobium catenatum]